MKDTGKCGQSNDNTLPQYDRMGEEGESWAVRQVTIWLFPGSANFGKTSQLFYYHMTNLIQSKSII
jgi:hypothetical protein